MLWAVHISEGTLRPEWVLAGLVLFVGLVVASCYRLHEEEIPRISLLTAAFFISSLIHVQAGPTSVHLLLNGLLGIMLGWRAPLAIGVGLLLQAALFGHGGFTTLGASGCVIAVPALLAAAAFRPLHRLNWRRRTLRHSVVFACTALWLACLFFSAEIIGQGVVGRWSDFDVKAAALQLLRPGYLAVIVALAILAAVVEAKLETSPEFPLGLLLGGVPVLLTVVLNSGLLIVGGYEQIPAYLQLAAHLPIAALEGVIVGFTLGFLAKTKPEMLGLTRQDDGPVGNALPGVPDEMET